jgi:hypothetical protein
MEYVSIARQRLPADGCDTLYSINYSNGDYMSYTFLPDVASFFLLCWTFVLLWTQRKQFQSLTPVAIAVVFLSIGRIADVILELSISRYSSSPLGWKRESFDLIMTNAGNICDVIGILFLIYGFFKTIEFQKKEEKRIEDLEILLPLCAWCKKYRSENGEWKPIEEYLSDSGAPAVTHGICPECASKQLDIANSRKKKTLADQ